MRKRAWKSAISENLVVHTPRYRLRSLYWASDIKRGQTYILRLYFTKRAEPVCAPTRHTTQAKFANFRILLFFFDQVLFLVGVRFGARPFRKIIFHIRAKSYFNPSFQLQKLKKLWHAKDDRFLIATFLSSFIWYSKHQSNTFTVCS